METLPISHCYLTYDEVITKAQAIQPHFEADLSQFTLYDPWFTATVNTELLSGIYIGQKDFSEDNEMAEIKHLLDLLDKKLADARHCYEKLTYYIDKGLGRSIDTYKTFGHSEFQNARCSVKRMIPLLNQVLTAISLKDNETILLKAGMHNGLPLEISILADELSVIYDELKILKKRHLQNTRERIELFNALWDNLLKICTDAKIIFATDTNHLAYYELFDLEDLDVQMFDLSVH